MADNENERVSVARSVYEGERPEVSFKNEDGSARNTPRVLNPQNGTDTKDGSVNNPVEEVNVSALRKVEREAHNAIEALLHPGEANG